jgi:3-hydroxyisobutyrate dehydrogenase-like beta-hydroxyacid dehydrogenase
MSFDASAPVSVIGLGRMGSSLAQALLRAGRPVTVYNRTPARSEPLRRQGAVVAAGLAQALAPGSIALVSLSNYDAAHALFFAPGGPDLRDTIIIQLSSGTPREARAWAERCSDRGARTLTGAILAYPMHIGTPQAQLLISGPENLYARYAGLLEMLGTPMHAGENPGGASAFDCAVLASIMLSMLGTLQGIELCRSESVDPAKFVAISNGVLAVMPSVNQMMLQAVIARNYTDPQATIDVWAATAAHVADIVAQHRMEPLLSETLTQMFARARASDLGNLDFAALAELLRAPGG